MKNILIVLTLLLILTSSVKASWTIGNTTTSAWNNSILFENTSVNQSSGGVEISQNPQNYASLWRADNNGNDDNVTSNNILTLVNGTTYGAGKFGNAFSFDGVNDFAWSPSSQSLNITSFPFSITAWIYLQTNGEYRGIIGKGESANSTNHNYAIEFDKTTDKVYAVMGDGVNYREFRTTTNFTINSWHHLSVVYNSTTDVNVYFDAINQNGVYIGSAATVLTANDKNLTIGDWDKGMDASSSDAYKGMIDDLRIYPNKFLIYDDIVNIMNRSSLTTGNVTISHNAGTNNLTKNISGYFLFPENTNATVSAYNNVTGAFLQAWTNITTSPWSQTLSDRTQDVKINITLYGANSSRAQVLNTTFIFQPTAPIILSPINNSRQWNNSVNISWTLNASDFHYQLSDQNDFSSIVNQGNVSVSYTIRSTTDGVTYYFRTRSNISDGYSNWSDVTQFTENILPVISDSNFLTPATPTITTNLTISLNITTDQNGDTISNHTLWYKNGILNTSWNDTFTLYYMNNFTTDDSIYVKAYLRDGYENTTISTSNQVIIGSGNSAPFISSITLNPTIRKYNKQVWINSSNITDSESSNIRLLTYYKAADESRVYLNNSTWYAPPMTFNLSFNNPWSDSNSRYIYAQVEDSGDAFGVNNLTSGEVQTTLTGDTTPPTVSTSSLSLTSIYIGAHVTINLNTSLSNGTVSNVSVHVSRPDATEADYVMNTTDNTIWSFKYTTTSDVGSYFIESFSMQDDSGNRGTETSALTFTATIAPTGNTGGGGGGGGSSTIVIIKDNNGTLTLVNVTSAENLKDLLKIGECFSSNLIFSSECAQSSISIVDQPLNWWTWFGSYIGSITTLFIISLMNDERKKFAASVLLYGTVAWVSVVLLSFMGLNLYVLNYVFNSPLPGFMFLSFTMWGGITTIVGDSYSKMK